MKPSEGGEAVELTINGRKHRVDVSADMPLRWVRDVIGLTGTKSGCLRESITVLPPLSRSRHSITSHARSCAPDLMSATGSRMVRCREFLHARNA
jgi:hypothetical protein